MDKSQEQFKHIQRISRQTRHHRNYLNQVSEQNLRFKLNQIANERTQTIQRSAARRELEEERKQLLTITVKQIVRERQEKLSPNNTIQTEEETVQVLSQDDETRPSSAVRFPSSEKPCRLFSKNCQLYPCQPIYQYTSFIRKDHDQILRNRPSSTNISNQPFPQDIWTMMQTKKSQASHRQLTSAMYNQHHQVHRHASIRRTMAYLDEQSRLLHERLNNRMTFGYVKEHRQQLSQDIQRHLKIAAKFCT